MVEITASELREGGSGLVDATEIEVWLEMVQTLRQRYAMWQADLACRPRQSTAKTPRPRSICKTRGNGSRRLSAAIQQQGPIAAHA